MSITDDLDTARRALADRAALTGRQEQVFRAAVADPAATREMVAHRTGLAEAEVAAAFREAEDLADAASAREALAEPGEIPWEQVKAEAGGD
jgi:hypothetical protein